jgi:hypothetical protein
MKPLNYSSLFLLACITPAFAMTVKSPTSGAHVTSPFQLVASAKTCQSRAAVSMGYSLDDAKATIVSTSFEATIVAKPGRHTLHVKCWAKQTNDENLLIITVVAAAAPPTVPSTVATPLFSPAPGSYTSHQAVTLTDASSGATVYYTTDGSAPTTASAEYVGAIPVNVSTVIEAMAVASGSTNSGMARADYVIATPPSSGPSIPSNAISATNIQLRDNWHYNHDAGTPGGAAGDSSIVDSPTLSGSARKFVSSFTGSGGEIYSVSYASDTQAHNFVYDNWVYIEEGSNIANLEMDSNQVTANGETVIYAFQCNGYEHVWDYSGAGVHWVHSKKPCRLDDWAANEWHHIQISYSRDDSGNVTYHSVWLDGTEQKIEATVPSSFKLGWKIGVVQTQFQMDGRKSGDSTDYVDNMTISRW